MIDHSVAAPHVHPSLRGFSTIELESMRRDGDIQRHGIAGYEFYLPIGTVPTAVDRAASLLPLWRPGRVFIEATARWIIRGGTPPEQIVIARNSTRRLPPVERVRWLNRRIPVKDRLQVGGVELWMPNAPNSPIETSCCAPGRRRRYPRCAEPPPTDDRDAWCRPSEK